MISSSRCTGAVLGLLLGMSALLHGADTLSGSSPFLPPSTGGEAATASTDAALELRGIMGADDQLRFSIYDPAKHMSSWKRLNEPGHEFVVRSYDASRDAVTVDYQGRSLTLMLKTAKVASAPASGPPIAGAAPQPVGGPVVLNPTPADEQRRLEAIAAEVNRRRMIRQQALQASRAAAGQPGRNPAIPPPQPVPQNQQR
jgi:hypothetical protein